MQINDDGCIRYLMKEMDPSEEIEFEREMMKDEDLLIEVETLRKSFQKLGKLPLHHPPKELSEQVLSMAVETRKRQLDDQQKWFGVMGRSVAAAVALLMIGSSGYYFWQNQSEPPGSSVVQQIQNADPPEPWVDRNQIIEFAGTSQQVNHNQIIQTDIDQSYHKLTLINEKNRLFEAFSKDHINQLG